MEAYFLIKTAAHTASRGEFFWLDQLYQNRKYASFKMYPRKNIIMSKLTQLKAVVVLVATAIATSDLHASVFSQAGAEPASKQELTKLYDDQLEALEREITRIIPDVSSWSKRDYLKALEQELEAKEELKEAESKMGELNSAKGLVEHAKGKWIGGAKKGIKEAEEKLKNAETREEEQAAKQELRNWEKNLKEGERALAERTRNWERLQRNQSNIERSVKQAKDDLERAKAKTISAIKGLGLQNFLSSDRLDGKLAKFVALNNATPRGLAEYASQSIEHQQRIERMLSNENLLVQMAVADGPRENNYGKAMEIYESIQKASNQAAEGVLQRLALAVALEHAEPHKQRNAKAAAEAPQYIDPLNRYLNFEQAYLDGDLDPYFQQQSAWDLRMVVNGEEPDEVLTWGREMLKAYRPDHITTKDNRWRYVGLVRSDIRYGSQENKYDKDELQFYQNILMNGGICGRRAFIGRFILRAFGNPTTARPQRGHAALVRWTPDGWVPVLGAGWGSGWTKTPYGPDQNFLATTQARALGDYYMQVKRAHWIGDVLGEERVYGLVPSNSNKTKEPDFWNGVALHTQRALIAGKDALGAVGEELGEANESEAFFAEVGEVTDSDRRVKVDSQGVITIPAAATSDPKENKGRIIFMPSALGGLQLHHARSGGKHNIEYTFKAPKAGTYNLVAKIAAPSWKQNLNVSLNGQENVATIPLPHTLGLWDQTAPIQVELKSGRNVLEFSHTSDGVEDKGFTIKEFQLVPASSVADKSL